MTDKQDIKALIAITEQAIQTAQNATEEIKRASEALQSQIDRVNQSIQETKEYKDIKGD